MLQINTPLDPAGASALHLAVLVGELDLVKHMLADLRANANIHTEGGCTPLHLVALAVGDDGHNTAKLITTLVEHGANINATTRDGMTALHCAALHSTKDVVQALLNAGGDVSRADNTSNTARDFMCLLEHEKGVSLMDHRQQAKAKNSKQAKRQGKLLG